MDMQRGLRVNFSAPHFPGLTTVSQSMRFLLATAMLGLTAVVLATGDTPSQEEKTQSRASAGPQSPELVQTGRTLGPLSPDGVSYSTVTVPEPVWASVLAACAVIVLRRGR